MHFGLCFKKCVPFDYSLPAIRGHMELFPNYARAVFVRRAVVAPRVFRGRRAQAVHVVVRRHDAQDLRRGKRAFRVHIAPPEYRLDPMEQRKTAVVAQHVPEAGVYALG